MYQSSQGGQIYVPLEDRGRVFTNTTPKMAKTLSWKYANLSSEKVIQDLGDNHSVKISKKYLQSVNERVGEVLVDKESKWTYDDEVNLEEVKILAISRDGAHAPIKGEGFKETMVGTISLYDSKGERLHTIYTGCPPEEGKSTFDYVFSQEIERSLSRYPQAQVVGLADGARDNWSFISNYTELQTIDFWHATEYLAGYAQEVYKQPQERKEWMDRTCHNLKYEQDAANQILEQMEEYATTHSITNRLNPITKAITYFTNNKDKMTYAQNLDQGLPIGSGVVEAGCKTLVKQRFSKSGCHWTRNTMDHVLLARSLVLTDGRWNQFWKKIDRYGF